MISILNFKISFPFIILVLSVASCMTSKKQQSANTITVPQSAQVEQPKKVMVGDEELHYIEQGTGETIILLHGGQGDYRAWPKQIEAFASRFHVISYSRRYHYPNLNPIKTGDHSPYVDAKDLEGFISALRLGPVHLVGTSYGAYTALTFALEHPELVRSLVLAEAPVLQWATNTQRGKELYTEFMTTVHQPAGKAFAGGDDEGAMRILINRFDGPGAFDSLPSERRKIVMQNSRFFRAITASSDPFPNLPREKVKQLSMPVLLVRGENTKELDILVIEELGKVIPNARRAVIPKAGHGSPRQNPAAFSAAVLEFLGRR